MKKILNLVLVSLIVVTLANTAGLSQPCQSQVKIEKVTSVKRGTVHCYGLIGNDTIYLAVKFPGLGKNRVRAGSILSFETKATDKKEQIYFRNIKLIQP